jgi:hypothetical protein
MADERIDSIIGQKAFDEVERLETGLKGLIDTFIKSSNAAKLLEAALLKETSIKGVNDAIKNQKTALSELEKYQKRIEDQVLKLAFAERELGKQMASNAVEIEQQNKINKNAARENLAAAGSINQMSASLIKMRMAYDAMSKAEREAAKGTDLLSHIQKLDAELKALDGSTGRFQRNVGDYKNQLHSLTQVFREMPAFAYSASTGIMGISNNLPILAEEFQRTAAATNESTGKVNGFAGALKIFGKSIFSFGNLFAIAIGLVTIFSARLSMAAGITKKTKESVDDLANAQDTLNMALKSTDYKKAVESVNELRINIDLARKGFLNKTDVVNQYNKTLGESLGAVTNLDDAEKILVKNGDAYIQMTLLKAAANLALDRAANEFLKAELKRQETKQALNENLDENGNFSPGALQSFKLLFTQGLGSDADNLQKETKKEVAGIEKEGDKFKQIAKDMQQQAALLAKAMGMDFFGNKFDKKTPKPKNDKENTIDLIKEQYEAEKALLETKLNDNLLTEEEFNSHMIDLARKYRDDRAGLTKKEKQDEILFNAELSKVEKGSHDKILKWIDDETKAVAEADDRKLQSTLKRLEEIKRLNAQYAKDELDLIRENLEANERMWQMADAEEEKRIQKKLESIQNATDIINAATNLTNTLSQIQYDREISKIDERDKKLQDSYDLEKATIDAKFISQVQKDKELGQLEARREAERKAAERDRVAAARRNAQRQKQLDVANIITTTSLAVMGALSRVKQDGPTAYAQAIAVGITGAAQLARALAAPLPQYKDGTDNHPGGFALVGEAGTERVNLPDGTSFLTKGPTVMDLPKRTEVISNDVLMKDLYSLAYRKLGNGHAVTTDTMTEALLESFGEMTKEMKGVKAEIRNLKLGVRLEGDMEHFTRMKNIIS